MTAGARPGVTGGPGGTAGKGRGVTWGTRRAALSLGGLGVLGVAGVAAGLDRDLLPGRAALSTALDGVLPVPAPDGEPGPVRRGSFVSAARLGERVGWVLALPPGLRPGQRVPVVVVLHGRGDDHEAMPALGLHRHLAAPPHQDGRPQGRPAAPFALASVAGGATYWHRRSTGEDAGAMVTQELLPRLRAEPELLGPGSRYGLAGWSMGGFGALLLASRLGPSRVAAVAAMSPALFADGDTPPEGAFDGPADRAAHDVLRAVDGLRGIAVRVDCGWGDPFRNASALLLDALRAQGRGPSEPAEGGIGAGGHDDRYWRRTAPQQLAFLGRALGAGA